jgi:carboxypeptidase family protein
MRFLRKSLGLAIVLMSAHAAVAQTTNGTVTGRVIDGQGLPIPHVTINATSSSLPGGRTTQTSENGDYLLANLPSGTYVLSFELSGFETQTPIVMVSPTQVSPVNVKLGVAGVTENVSVVGDASVATKTALVAIKYKQDIISALPTNRAIEATLLQAPSVHPTGPGGAYSFNGSMSFEPLYLVNGATVSENLRGQPLPMFIEDAIQETTIATAGISAEFGRFDGGVVNVITKSGGNTFGGSFRDTLMNDNWRSLTPFPADTKVAKTVPTYEYTFGGPVAADRLWFFTAGRIQDSQQARTTAITLIPYTFESNTQRYEGKLTYAVARGSLLQGSFVKLFEDQVGASQNPANVMDLNSLYTAKRPQNLFTVTYTGAISSRLALEARLSVRNQDLVGVGATRTDLIAGTLLLDNQRGTRYWAPTFCGVCDPESRDNDDVFVKGSYFLSTRGTGSHNMVFGYDTFDDKRFANNHQSGSDYRILGTTSIVQGGTIYPVFAGDGTTLIRYNPIVLGTHGTHFRIHSLFYNDNWQLNSKLTFNLGLRFDKNHGRDGADQLITTDSSFSPRLGVIWDPTSDGKWSITASFAKYVTSVLNSLADASSPAGNFGLFDWLYRGPGINTNAAAPLVTSDVAIQQVFNWFNANSGTAMSPVRATYPGVSVKIPQGLDSPDSIEYALGVSRQLGSRTTLRLDGVFRDYRNFYSQRIDMSTGRVTDPSSNRFDVIAIENTNDVTRKYAGLTASMTYRVNGQTEVGGNYTLSHTYGNVDGENTNTGPIPTDIYTYPEYKQAAWAYPMGDLSVDQRHRVRIWATYGIRQVDGLSVSVLQDASSGVPYGAVGVVDARTFVTNPGYVTPQGGSTEAYYYTARDAFRTEATYRTDVALNYSRRIKAVRRQPEIFAQAQLLNAFNGFQLCGCGADVFSNGGGVVLTRIDQSVLSGTNSAAYQKFNPFTTTPVQGVNWNYGPNFGKALSRLAYTTPRTFRLTFGVRF